MGEWGSSCGQPRVTASSLQRASMAPAGDTQLPSAHDIKREVTAVLRGADDPNLLTFKQVRLAVEASLGLPEGSLRKESKEQIRLTVLSVMDEIDADLASSEVVETATGDKSDTAEGEGSARSSSKRRKLGGAADTRTESGKLKLGGKAAQGRDAAGEGVKGKQKSGSGDVKGSGREDGNDDDLVCVLSEGRATRRQVSVKTWKRNVQVDVREYYTDKATGEYRPGYKGVTLNPSQWEALKDAAGAVDAMVDAIK